MNKADLFGRNNQFLIGSSYDNGNSERGARWASSSPRFVVEGGGIFLSAPDDVETKSIGTQNDYFGLYFSDTFETTERLTLTEGWWAVITTRASKSEDQTGNTPDLNGVNQYVRFNPCGRRHLQAQSGRLALWRILGSEPGADRRGTCLLRCPTMRA